MKRSRIADAGLLLVALMWGCTFLIVQHAVRVLPPLAFNGIRFIGAALLLLLIIGIFYRSELRKLSWPMVGHAVILGGLLFLGYGFQTVGLLYTTTSNTGFITGLSVVLVPLFSLLLLKTPITRFTLGSIVLAAIGLYLLAFAESGYTMNRGDLLVFLCAIAFALHVAYTGVFSPKYPALPLTALQMAFVGILSLLGSAFTEQAGSLEQVVPLLLKPEVLWALCISIGPTSAFAFWIQTSCQKYTSPARVAVIFAMEPVFAAITGVLFGGEILGMAAIVGCGCILAGMLLSELKSPNLEVQ